MNFWNAAMEPSFQSEESKNNRDQFSESTSYSKGAKLKSESDHGPSSSAHKEEEVKNEEMFVRIVRGIRKKIVARRLIADIAISNVIGVITSSMRISITAKTYENHPDPFSEKVTAEDLKDLSAPYKKAITMTDTILDSLERRALGWDGVDFSDDAVIARGARIGISDPIVGLIGYSFQLDISATIKSLIESRKRYKFYQKTAPQDEGFFGGLFNFFSGNNTNQNSEHGATDENNSNSNSRVPGPQQQLPQHQVLQSDPVGNQQTDLGVDPLRVDNFNNIDQYHPGTNFSDSNKENIIMK